MTSGKALHRLFDSRLLAWAVVVTLSLLLAGCPSTPRRGGPPNVDRAEQLSRSGDQAGAAALYERLANEAPADAAEFRLRAARAWLAARRPADAERVLALVVPEGLTQQQQ